MLLYIRDRYVTPQVMSFLPWWNPAEWNRTSLELGLFDFQNVARPTYFLFRLLSRLTGDRLEFESDQPAVHGLASYDATLKDYSLLLWNFSDSPAHIELSIEGAPSDLERHGCCWMPRPRVMRNLRVCVRQDRFN